MVRNDTELRRLIKSLRSVDRVDDDKVINRDDGEDTVLYRISGTRFREIHFERKLVVNISFTRVISMMDINGHHHCRRRHFIISPKTSIGKADKSD